MTDEVTPGSGAAGGDGTGGGTRGAAAPSRDALLAILHEELAATGTDVTGEIPTDRHLTQDLGIDSLDVVEFVARVELRLRFTVPDEDWQRLATLDAIADYALERL